MISIREYQLKTKFLNNKQCARIAFSAMASEESVTQETYKYTILGDLEDLFGWKESSFIDYHPVRNFFLFIYIFIFLKKES